MRFSLRSAIVGIILIPVLLGACSRGNPQDNTGQSTSQAPKATLQVSRPNPNDIVTSPLAIYGSARGMWYFEASFPVSLVDAAGKKIASTSAKAKGEWMTEDFVPFEATMTFKTAAATGSLIFEKDNPSGLPENAATIVVPVRFR